MFPSEYWLRHAQNDFWYQHQMPIFSLAVSRMAGYKDDKYDSIVEDSSWLRLEPFLPDIESRRVIFRKYRFYVTDLPPCVLVQKINSRWQLNAVCTSCGGNKFLPAKIEKEYAMCYDCIPPSQYKPLGATLLKNSFIDEYIEKTYSASCP